MANTIESLKNEKENLQKHVEVLGKEERKKFQDEIAGLKKKRIWGIIIATVVFLLTAVIMFLLAQVVVAKPMNTEQAVVLSVIVVGWYVLIGAFCQIFGHNNDTWC
jgi:Flp pilus assembly protein TadB